MRLAVCVIGLPTPRLSAAVFAQLSFRNSFQLNESSDLRVSCRQPTCQNRYSARVNVIETQSAANWTAILDRRREILHAILASRKQLTCSVESATTETMAQFVSSRYRMNDHRQSHVGFESGEGGI